MKTSIQKPFQWTMQLVLSLMLLLVVSSCEDQMETTYTYQTQVPVFFAGQYLQGSRHHHRNRANPLDDSGQNLYLRGLPFYFRTR